MRAHARTHTRARARARARTHARTRARTRARPRCSVKEKLETEILAMKKQISLLDEVPKQLLRSYTHARARTRTHARTHTRARARTQLPTEEAEKLMMERGMQMNGQVEEMKKILGVASFLKKAEGNLGSLGILSLSCMPNATHGFLNGFEYE